MNLFLVSKLKEMWEYYVTYKSMYNVYTYFLILSTYKTYN